MTLLTAFVLLMGSCTGKQNTEPGGAALTVSPSTVTFVSLGEQKTFSVTSSTDWLARSNQSWLKIVTASGKGGASATQLIVSAEDNKTTSERSAQLTVSNLGKESLTLDLRQEAGQEGGHTDQRGIATAEDLVAFAKAANGEGSITPFLVDGAVKILNDIDCSSIKEWVPAGTEQVPLTYSINGNNKTLKNVNWTVDVTKYPHAGLIGYAQNMTVSKLTFGEKGNKVTFAGDNGGKVRAGGIVGYGMGITLNRVTNNADLVVSGTASTGSNLIVGGLVGYQNEGSTLGGELQTTHGCINNGNVTASVVAQAGGLVGYNSGVIQSCTNNGTITAGSDASYGPAWLCSYNRTKANVTSNFGYGFVGDTPAMHTNAIFNGEAAYDLENNTVDWTLDAYYDWEEVERRQLHSGATYYHYHCVNVPRHVHVLEIDLKDPGIEVTQAIAGEIVPNPNGNNYGNNGFNLRERLSDVCKRRRAEGQKVLAGINCSFFDSHYGFPRGHVVEEGEPIFINNTKVANGLPNHKWSFTVFADGTASCGVKKFTGKIRRSGKEYDYHSINDTILVHSTAGTPENGKYLANLFTSRYVRTPYSSKPKLVNELAPNVLYVICEYTGQPMKVNTGYAEARVVKVVDGRYTALPTASLPYFTEKNRVGIALSGDTAAQWTDVKAGDTVEFRCDIAIDGDASKPIYQLNSTMFMLLDDGKDASNTPGSSSSLYSQYDPITFPVVSQDRTKVWLVEVDGRQVSSSWYSLGLKGYEVYRIAKKLGGWWSARMDGGGSSAMWVWNASSNSGSIVNRPSDSKGERSCMTYVLIREK